MTAETAWIIASPNRTLRQRELMQLVQHLRQGGLAALPTDTGPMLACDALNVAALTRLFEVKGRPEKNPIHVAVADVSQTDRYAHVPPSARRVMRTLLPGPLTVICPKRDIVPDLLVAGTGNLGLRVPDCPVTLAICAAFGGPLTSTSLNLSGQPASPSLEEELRKLHWREGDRVYAVRDPLQTTLDRPSTVVRILAEGSIDILREGPISRAEIEQAMTTPSDDGI